MASDNLIARLLWLFVQPSNFITFVILLSIYLVWKGRRAAGLYTLFSCAAFYILVMFGPLTQWLLVPLEKRFSPYTNDISHLPYSGIIVLAGGEQLDLSARHHQVSLSDAAERLLEAAKLARLFPDLPVIYSGGIQIKNSISETDIAHKFFQEAGIDPKRIRFEGQSYNTYSNALQVKKLIAENETAPWLLVTSAFHMPRSVGAFRTAGIKIQPYPVDYRSTLSYSLSSRPDAGKNLQNLDYAFHEWLGLVVYYIRGYNDTLFPSLKNGD